MPADIGAFLQGFTNTFQMSREQRSKREEMEMNKKLLAAKLKAMDIESEMKNKALTAIMAQMTSGGGQSQQPTMQDATNATMFTPQAQAGPSAPMPMPQGTQAQPMGGGMGGGSIDDFASSIPGQILFQQGLGFVPKPQEAMMREIADPTGRPVLQAFTKTGLPIEGRSYPTAKQQEPSFTGKEMFKKAMTDLPELEAGAISANNMTTQISRALKLIEKGVTGKGGQAKAFLAPYAEMLGVESEALSDAQLYQLLTRAIIGPMRLEIIGPGPVSEWEQKLMQQISGGGSAAKESARTLLNHWALISGSKIDRYNNALSGLSGEYPEVKIRFKPIQRKQKPSLDMGGNKSAEAEAAAYLSGR